MSAKLEVDQDSPDLGQKLKQIRDSAIEHILGIYTKEGLHPWLRMFLATLKLVNRDMKLPANTFLDKFYTHRDADVSEQLQQNAVLGQAEQAALEELESLKQTIVAGFAGDSQRLASDLRTPNKAMSRPDSVLEKDYLSVQFELSTLFESISESIKQARLTFIEQFVKSLKRFVDEVINPEIAKNMYVSELNENLDILTRDNLVSFARLYDIALATGLIHADSQTEMRIMFKFLDLAYYQKLKKSILI